MFMWTVPSYTNWLTYEKTASCQTTQCISSFSDQKQLKEEWFYCSFWLQGFRILLVGKKQHGIKNRELTNHILFTHRK